MGTSLAEKLSILDRPRTTINIQSRRDKKESVKAIYQRPTDAAEGILQQALNDEYDAAIAGFHTPGKDGKSVYDSFRDALKIKGRDTPIAYIVGNEGESIRVEVIQKIGTPPPEDDASEEVKAEYLAQFRELYAAEVEVRKERYAETDLEELLDQAADIRIGELASRRANEIYRRALVAISIYDEVEDDGEKHYVPAFKNGNEVAEMLAVETIEEIARRVREELAKVRNLPLS